MGRQSNSPACLFVGAGGDSTFGRMDISVAVRETGWHELHAVAIDPLGQYDPEGDTHRFYADFEAPKAHLKLPSVQRENRTISRVNCTDNYACADKLTVSIDGGAPFETTRTSFDTGELLEGRHQIRLWAHDEAGNKQIKPTVVPMKIDQTPPFKPTIVLVGDDETLEVSIGIVSIDTTGTWQLEYQQEAATDCAPAIFAMDPKWSGPLHSKLVIGSSTDPLPARIYRLQVMLMDEASNVAQYVSETAKVIGEALPRPAIMRLNASALNISSTVAVVDVQWSTDELFKRVHTKTRRSQLSPLVIDVTSRLVDTQVFLRVSKPGMESWSVPTKAWVNTKICLDSQCLEDTSHDPPELAVSGLPQRRILCGTRYLVRRGGQIRVLARARSPPQQFRACLLPSACLVRPTPISIIATTTGRGRPRIWRDFTGGIPVGNQRHVMRTGASNRNVAAQAAAKTSRPPPVAFAAPVVRDSSAKDWLTVPYAQSRVPIVRCWPLVYLRFCLVQPLLCSCQFGRRELWRLARPSRRFYSTTYKWSRLLPLPMRWPDAVQSFFEAQAAISSASKSLLSPACELSYMRAAQAFCKSK